MPRERLADRDEGRGLGQPVHLGDLPAELAFDALDRRGSRGGARRHDADAGPDIAPHLGGAVGEADQDRRRGAEHRHRLGGNRREDALRLDPAQADVRRANRRDGPDERPAIGVEHRQRPQIAVGRGHVQVDERADGVHVRIAMRDHHAFRARGRAARVVDRQQIVLADLRAVESLGRGGEQRFVVQPAVARLPFQADEVLHAGDLTADAVHHRAVVGMDADDPRAAVIEDVGEIVRDQAVVDRHEHRAELRHGVVALRAASCVFGAMYATRSPRRTPNCCKAADQRSHRAKNSA